MLVTVWWDQVPLVKLASGSYTWKTSTLWVSLLLGWDSRYDKMKRGYWAISSIYLSLSLIVYKVETSLLSYCHHDFSAMVNSFSPLLIMYKSGKVWVSLWFQPPILPINAPFACFSKVYNLAIPITFLNLCLKQAHTHTHTHKHRHTHKTPRGMNLSF